MFESILLCLALNIYHEARGEPIEGQIAVGYVTLNRAKNKNVNVCNIVFEHKQFSWTNYYRNRKQITITIKDVKSWNEILDLSGRILRNEIRDNTEGATYFHSIGCCEKLFRKFNKTKQIGNHIFYK